MKNLQKFLLIILGIFNISAYKYDLAVCAIFKDEAEWLEEWIDFHKRQGVEHFFLYNNNSTDYYEKTLEPYIKNGEVDLINWDVTYNGQMGFVFMQRDAYLDCVNKNKSTCKWIAFIDTDEFLFSVDNNKLPQTLNEYEEYGGIAVNWLIYGTSSCKKSASKNMLKSLVHRLETDHDDNTLVKCIVRPEHVAGSIDCHIFLYNPGKYAVTENKEPLFKGKTEKLSCNKLRINHYTLRDLTFLEDVKISRLRAWHIDPTFVYERDRQCHVYDPILADR